MPPLALTSLLQGSLPWLSTDGRAVLHTLVSSNGRVGSVQTLCRHLGLRSRFQLNRLLRREGLPSFEELSGWVCVLYWMLQADAGVGHGALLPLSRQAAMKTATSYRLVRRVTKHSWKDLRRAGTSEVVRWFRQRVHPAASRLPSGLRTLVRPNGGGAPAPQLVAAQRAVTAQPQRVPLAGAPYGIAVGAGGGRPNLAYVTLGHAASLGQLDLIRRRITGIIPVGCTPTCVKFDQTGERAYVTIQFCDEIAVIDTAAHVQIRTLALTGQPFPLLIAPSGNTLFVTTNTDRLWALNPHSGRVTGSLVLPATSHHLALHPGGDRLYVATRAAGSVLEVDASRLRMLRTFALGGWPQGLVVSPDGALLYVANEQQALDVIQLSSGKHIAKVDQERGAVALALSPNHRLLYTGHPRQGMVGVVDVPSLHHRGLLQTGGRPGQIAFDAAGDVIIVNEAGWIDFLPLGEVAIAAA